MADTYNNSSRNEIILHPNRGQGTATRVLYLEPLNTNGQNEDGPAFAVESWRVIGQRLPWIVAIVVVGALAGAIWSFWQTPVYEANVSMEIQNANDGGPNVQMADIQPDGSASSPESYLPTQAAILQSRTLQQHALAKVANERLRSESAPAGRPPLLRRIFAMDRGQAAAASKGLAAPTIKVQIEPGTRIIQIFSDSPDPQLAAAYANALSNEYMDSTLQARWDAINHARQWLQEQLDGTRVKLQNSEDQLQAYGRASNLMFTGDKKNAEQDKLIQIQSALSDAQADRIAKQSAYRIASSTPADSVPQVIDNARLSEYQAQLADLQRQLAELNSEYTPEHPKVKRVQAQIDQLQATFTKNRDNILTRIRNEYQSALMRENLLGGAYRQQAVVVADQTQKEVNYGILERDVDTNRQLYDTLLQKSREADIATAMRGSNVRIIDLAVPPARPDKPNLPWNILLGALSGLVGGLTLVLMRERFDRSFKAPGDVPFHLKLPELGVIPEGELVYRNGNGKSPTLTMLPPVIPAHENAQGGAVELITWRDKSSTIAECFRSALTSVLHSGENGTVPRVILVSSAAHGEGKTTIVSNLGIALAEINQRVLLIDADMRKPRLSEVFNVPNNWGLSDLLREKGSLRDGPLEALVQRTEIPNLSILTSGPRTTSITNLLYSERMLELLQRFRGEFDRVLIDTPPMLQIADARILGRLVDTAILVFRAGRTSRDAALAAKRRLTDDGIPVLGTILNAWDVKGMSRYGYVPYDYNYQLT